MIVERFKRRRREPIISSRCSTRRSLLRVQLTLWPSNPADVSRCMAARAARVASLTHSGAELSKSTFGHNSVHATCALSPTKVSRLRLRVFAMSESVCPVAEWYDPKP